MKSRVDRIINLLVDEIEGRMEARDLLRARERLARRAAEEPLSLAEPVVAQAPIPSVTPPAGLVEAETPTEQRAQAKRHPLDPEPESEREPELPPASPGHSHAARLMGRLALGLLAAIVVINIPLNRHGVTLATAMPDSASLIIHDGLVVKEVDDPEIYVYQNGKFRWISSLDAFEHYGFTWGDVREVPDGYLDRYEFGTPLHVLLKCRDSPHVYGLEDGAKRWIRDIDTFTAAGYVWEDVRFVSCQYLRDLPDGETIPPGSGPPPQP